MDSTTPSANSLLELTRKLNNEQRREYFRFLLSVETFRMEMEQASDVEFPYLDTVTATTPATDDKDASDFEQSADATQSLLETSVCGNGNSGDRKQPSQSVTRKVSTIRRFNKLRPHARGGLGQVFVAEDTELGREVALKQIKEGYSNQEETRARFFLEAELTGRLEHPGIVPVYGLGVDPSGVPMYAMKFIKGHSLKEEIAQFHEEHGKKTLASNNLDLRAKLSRFVDVCNAIEYAHSCGVIHRDIKPANIMLGKFGETLVVDWGIAKQLSKGGESVSVDEASIGSPMMDSTTGAVMGTLPYMSPEQARGEIEAVDKSSDVFSLGATLYHLLTGRAPYSNKPMQEMLEDVRACRFEPIQNQPHQIPRPLAAICHRSMAANKVGRYSSCRDLSLEVERFLADEPVLADRNPLRDRARRWMRKHQTLASTTATVMVVGFLAAIVASALIGQKNRQLFEKNEQLIGANKLVAEERENAIIERDTAVAINLFVRDELLGQASPEKEPDREIRLRTVVDRAASSMKNRFENQPLVKAGILISIGRTYLLLGELASAELALTEAQEILGDLRPRDHPDTFALRELVALLARVNGQAIESQRMLESLLTDLADANLEETPGYYYTSLNLIQGHIYAADFAAGESLLLDLIPKAQAQFGDEHLVTTYAYQTLGWFYRLTDRLDQSEQYYAKVLSIRTKTLGDDHYHIRAAKNALAIVLVDRQQEERAESLFEEVISSGNFSLQDSSLESIETYNGLAKLYIQQGRFEEAEPICVALIEKCRQRPDQKSKSIAATVNLARCYLALERTEEALSLAQVAKDSLSETNDFFGLAPKANLAKLLIDLDETSLGEELLVDVLSTPELAQWNPHLFFAASDLLCGLYLSQFRFEEAEPVLIAQLESCRQRPDQKTGLLTVTNNLANCYIRMNRLEEALPHAKAAYEGLLEENGELNVYTNAALSNLAACYQRTQQYALAQEAFEKVLESSQAALGPNDLSIAVAHANLGLLHRERENFDEAISYLENAVRIRVSMLGESHRYSQLANLELAISYLDARRSTEGTELLRHITQIDKRENYESRPAIWARVNEVARKLMSEERYEEYLPLGELMCQIQCDMKGDEHRDTLMTELRLAICLQELEQFQDAAFKFERIWIVSKREYGETDNVGLSAALRYGQCLESTADYLEAEAIYASNRTLAIGASGPESDIAIVFTRHLADVYYQQQKYDLEHAMRIDLLQACQNRFGPEDENSIRCLQRIGRNCLLRADYVEAEETLREAIDAMQELDQSELAMSRLHLAMGEAILGQGRTEDAEEWLEKGYAGMVEHRDELSAEVLIEFVATLDRLIELFTESSDDRNLEVWSARRADEG